MTFSVQRGSLLAELRLLRSIVESKAKIPMLQMVRLSYMEGDVLNLAATDMDTSVLTEVAASGQSYHGCVPCKQLYGLVKLFSDDKLKFTPRSNGRLEISCGKASHKLPVVNVTDFPEIERAEGETIMVDTAVFNRMLQATAFAALTTSDYINQSDQRFTGIDIQVKKGRLNITATNTKQLASASIAVDSPLEFETVIPRQAVGPLLETNEGPLTIDLSESRLHFANGTRHLYTRRLTDDKFPDWRGGFPAEYEHAAEIETATLDQAIKRAMLTANEGRFVKDGLRWTLGPNELLIETRGGDKGKSDEVVAISCPSLNGSPVVLGMNGVHVVDGLSLLGDKATFRFSAGANVVELRPVAVSDIAFTYYISTVSLRNWQ